MLYEVITVGLMAGFVMHRSDFCLAGAFRDWFLFKDGRRLRALVLLMTVSAIGFELLRLTGGLPYYPFPWFAPPGLTNLLGGCLFGIGMVLAGGCVVGVLYKAGSGSMPAIVAILGLLTGSAVYAEFHVITSYSIHYTKLYEVVYCDWMRDEGWRLERGTDKKWFKPAPAG